MQSTDAFNDVRYYSYNIDYIIIEDRSTMTPMLISYRKTKMPLSVAMFKELKEICQTMFGDYFTLKLGHVGYSPAIFCRKLTRID